MPVLQGKRVGITISMRKEWKSHDRGTQVQPQVVEKIDDGDLKLGILRAPSQIVRTRNPVSTSANITFHPRIVGPGKMPPASVDLRH